MLLDPPRHSIDLDVAGFGLSRTFPAPVRAVSLRVKQPCSCRRTASHPQLCFTPDRRQKMRQTIALLLLTGLAAGGCATAQLPCLNAAPPVASSRAVTDADLQSLDAYIRRAMDDWKVPGLAMAVVQGESVVFARGFGVRELGRPEPVDTRTLFGLLSPTKTFTAAALAMLADEGRISLDDRVVDHLPDFRVADAERTSEIRIRDLLSHRTGYEENHRLWYNRGGTPARWPRGRGS
jgi:CubicO group peptidase (beta-lactamase class C family)